MRLFATTTRSLLMTALAVHVVAAVGWWWTMPGGFGFGSGRFWVNSIVSVVVLGVAGIGLWAIDRRPRVAGWVAVGLGAM